MIRVPVVQAWDVSYLEAIKKLLHSSYFCQIIGHLIVVAAVLFLYLFCHELRVSRDEKLSNAELLG
jgi:predicted benzoate:H+ symporter BenE